MAIFGRPEFLPVKQRDSILELAGVRGFGGEFEKSLYVKGVEGKDLAPLSAGELLIDSARMQQVVAKSRPEHWAEVHGVGMGEKGAFSVVDYYSKSAAQLIKTGTDLSGRGLYRIVMAVVRGLRDLQHVAGRPHGNLKPSNVLLSSSDAASAQIALTDPAPNAQVARGKADDDLFQLGQLIHELVLHHPFTGAWPVAPTRAWNDLGRSGRGWRKLCNRLLNPNPEKRPRRLAWVHGRVLALRPRRRVLEPALMLLFLAAMGVVAGTQSKRIVSWTRAHWPPLVAATTQPANSEQERPKQLVMVPQTVDRPTTRATQTTQPTQTLAEESQFLGEYQSLYEQRGWSGPAQYLSNLRGRFAITGASDAAAKKALGDAQDQLKKIEERWKGVGENANFITQRANNDPVLLTYPQFLREAIGPVIARTAAASPLPALLEALEKASGDPGWNGVIAFLRSSEAPKLDHPWMIESSPLHKRFANKTVASAEDLQAWLSEVKQPEFQRLASSDDPRPRWSARQQINRIRGNDLARLESLYKDPAEAKKASIAFEQKLGELDQSAAKVLASDSAWSVKNRPEITSAIAGIDRDISKTAEELRAAVANRQTEVEQMATREAAAARQRQEAMNFVGKLESTKVSSNAAIQKEWQLRTRAIAEDIRADANRFRPAMAEEATEIGQRLKVVDEAVGALPEKLQLKGGNAAWNERLTAALQGIDARQRERMVADLVASSRETRKIEDLKAKAAAIRKKYDQWTVTAANLVDDLNQVDQLLGAGYSLDERPAQDRPTAREILQQWQQQDLFASDAIQSPITPLVAPIRVLEKADTQTLVQISANSEHRLGLRLMAWRYLAGGAIAWPAEREELKQALEISEGLAAMVERSAPQERREVLKGETARATAKLWNRFAARAKSADDIAFAMGLSDKLAIPLETLDARTRFNLALYDARRDLGQGSNEKTMAQVTESLQTALDGLPKGLAQPTATLATALRQSRDGAQRTDFATLGPMARRGNPINWKVKYDETSQTVSYTARVSPEITPDELEIVFKRVDGEGGDVYLSTTEVSVGLFADVITAADRWREVAPTLWSYDPRDGDPRPGPRSWEWPRYGRLTSGIRRTNVWLAGSGDHYPQTLATAENRTVLKDESGRPAKDLNPSKRQPMQYVSPEAAIYFCDLVSCRLPTSGEWKSAYRLYAGDHWNLRDRTFKVLQRWMYGPSVAERFMPDLGIFMSAGEKATAEIWLESKLSGRPTESDREYDDGVLWFREIAPAGMQVFNHLVGNVAEMTLENGHLSVIGGSALSPPTRPVDQELEIANWRSGNKGYSDIGFRMAFSGPPNARQVLVGAVEKQGYLLP